MSSRIHYQLSSVSPETIVAIYDEVKTKFDQHPDDMRKLLTGSGPEHVHARAVMRALGARVLDAEAQLVARQSTPDTRAAATGPPAYDSSA